MQNQVNAEGTRLPGDLRVKEKARIQSEGPFPDFGFLGEPLLIIVRHVIVPDTKDRLDLLANAMLGRGIITP